MKTLDSVGLDVKGTLQQFMQQKYMKIHDFLGLDVKKRDPHKSVP